MLAKIEEMVKASKQICSCVEFVAQDAFRAEEGFVKASVYDKSEYCERCFKIIHYGEYSVLDKKIDTDGIIKNINSDKNSSVAFLVDSLNINEKIMDKITTNKNFKLPEILIS